jgi:hypothetical protein
MYVKAGLGRSLRPSRGGYTTKEISGYNARLSRYLVAFSRAEDM